MEAWDTCNPVKRGGGEEREEVDRRHQHFEMAAACQCIFPTEPATSICSPSPLASPPFCFALFFP